MTGRVQGKVALVTGAGSGIGRAMALLLAREGAHVVVVDITEAVIEVAHECGDAARALIADISDAEQVKAMIAKSIEYFGRLDIVCNNAGRSGGVMPLHETPIEHFDSVIGTNLRGAFLVLQHSIAQMLRNGGGSIINTASVASVLATPGTSSYTASKGGVMAMTRVAAAEYAARGIRVNAILPGVTETPMVAKAPDDIKARFMDIIPMKRLGRPEEMAHVALFLASDDSSFVTGIGLVADGGQSAI